MSSKSKKTQKNRNKNSNNDLTFARKLYYENESRYKVSTKDEWVYNKIIAEIILQIYLIYCDYRKMAEIKLSNIQPKIKSRILEYLKKNKINYEIIKDRYKPKEDIEYLYLFNKRHIPQLINDNRGIEMAEQLGEFYTCKSRYDEWKTYEWRIVIFCNDIEIFAQMCTEDQISKNIKRTMNVYNEIRDLFIKLDEKRFKNTIPNPLKISIYKTKVI